MLAPQRRAFFSVLNHYIGVHYDSICFSFYPLKSTSMNPVGEKFHIACWLGNLVLQTRFVERPLAKVIQSF